ncbi:MAG: hypothetical protein NTZ74_09405 [Chloroflexi bacterium]|nr:hypothetical protein [Chloroflexota bacterium]
MENINIIVSQLNRQFLGGAKIPHGMSNPVLRKYNGQFVIATFFYTFKKEHLDAKLLPRPTYWMVADIDTGKLIEDISCLGSDFSNQSFNELYLMEMPDSITPTPEYFEELFRIFDEVRYLLMKNGVLDFGKYSEYMTKMLAVVPPSYHIFYRELSEEV